MSESGGGAVSVALGKRVRAVKKKINKAEQIEQAVSAGKGINEDQMETMKSKPGCLAVIDELSKLEVLLKEAAAEEVNAAKAKWQEEAAKKEAEADAKIAALEALVATTAAQSAESPEPEAVPSDLREKIIDETIEQLVPLIYFSRMFEKSSELLSSNPMERNACIEQLTQNEHVRERERFACRSWVNQSAADVMKDEDMDLIVQFGRLVTCRPAGQIISHEMAMLQCCRLAKKLVVDKSEVLPELALPGHVPPTSGYVSEQISKIKASEYFTVKPVNSIMSQELQQASPTTSEQISGNSHSSSSQVPAQLCPPSRTADLHDGTAPPRENMATSGGPPPPMDPSSLLPSSGPNSSGAAPSPPSGPLPPTPASGAPSVSISTGSGMLPHEQWPFAAMGMSGSPSGINMPLGMVPATHAAAAGDPAHHGQPHPYQQPGMHMTFTGHTGFMMPQPGAAMPHMMPPGAFPDPMYAGMPYMPPPGTKMEGPGMHMVDVGKGGLMPGSGGKDGALMGSNGHMDGGQQGQGGRSNARVQGGDRGRGGRNRAPRGDGGRGGGRGDGRQRNFDGGRGSARGRGGRPQQGQQPPPPPPHHQPPPPPPPGGAAPSALPPAV